MTTQRPKLGSIRRDDSKKLRPQQIYTHKGWVSFCCDHCGEQCEKSPQFNFCPKCGADYTVDRDELIHGERMHSFRRG